MLFFEPAFLLSYAVFLPVYYFLKGQSRVFLIVVASYLFYGWFDYRFVSLLIISTIVDYIVGLGLGRENDKTKRKLFLLASIIVNLGILATFKYFNFFIDSFATLFQVSPEKRIILELVLPPGISFYTFQTLSYSIDVYRGKFKPERRLVNFAAYVAFFPQLLAGPIERPKTLLPQIARDHGFKYSNLYLGLRLFLFGCFKKLVIADNLSPYSDAVFSEPGEFSSLRIALAAYIFAIQIYCDFSGYTDMARGIARSLGIRLSENFRLPYLSASIGEFWRRWHITLSYWLRDYVYIPLGGSRGSFPMHLRNLLITFGLSGLWHGAAWAFILWGILHGLIIVFENIWRKLSLPNLPKIAAIFVTFHIVVILWVLFRAQSLDVAISFYSAFFATEIAATPADYAILVQFVFYTSPLVVMSLWQYFSGTMAPDRRAIPLYLHAVFLAALLFSIILFGADNATQFVYFQF